MALQAAEAVAVQAGEAPIASLVHAASPNLPFS
jgi:hypothetical protein